MSPYPSDENRGERRPDEIDLGDGRVIVLRQADPQTWQGAAPRPSGRPGHLGPSRAWLIGLFLATVASTFLQGGGRFDAEGNPFFDPYQGLLYAAGIMTILLCHELGHFLQARRYGVPASWPIFLPMPLTFLGTLGALIVMRPRTATTRQMFDIAITGPLAGLVPTFACLLIGLPQSRVVPLDGAPGGTELGEPLVLQWLTALLLDVPAGHTVLIGPLALAGWFGLLITALNLLPVGQLDGGHIMYTLARRHAYNISAILLLSAALVMIVTGYWMWTLMLILLLVFGIRHPPLADDPVPEDLGWPRRLLGWITLLISAFLFLTPMPFQPPDL